MGQKNSSIGDGLGIDAGSDKKRPTGGKRGLGGRISTKGQKSKSWTGGANKARDRMPDCPVNEADDI